MYISHILFINFYFTKNVRCKVSKRSQFMCCSECFVGAFLFDSNSIELPSPTNFSKWLKLLLKVAQKAPAFNLIPFKIFQFFFNFPEFIQLFPSSKIQKRCHNVQRVIYHLISFMIYYSSTCWNNMQLHNHFEMKTVF